MYERIKAHLELSNAQVVGQADTPQSAIDGILLTQPDVVVLDVHLVGGKGLQVLSAIRGALPQVAFVVFSNHSEPAYRKRYLKEGAACFLDKNNEFDQLAQAVNTAAQHRFA